jgi:hypothetical protein
MSTLLVSYLKKCISSLEHWLRDWRIAINLWTNISVLFDRLRDDPKGPATTDIMETSGSTQPIWSANINQVGRTVAQRLDMLDNSFVGGEVCQSVTVFCLVKSCFFL